MYNSFKKSDHLASLSFNIGFMIKENTVQKRQKRWLLLLGLIFLSVVFLSNFAGAATEKTYKLKQSWMVLGGYGVTHPGLGNTKTHVETFDLILRYEKALTAEMGSSWYRGHHSLMVELPISFVVDPSTDPMYGLTLLGSWIFAGNDLWQPYLLGGGGIVYTSADITGLGAELNASWQLGFGLRYKALSKQIFLEYRFHHISNTGRKDPNDPLNSSKILMGIKF